MSASRSFWATSGERMSGFFGAAFFAGAFLRATFFFGAAFFFDAGFFVMGKSSSLEMRFKMVWRSIHGPELEEEFRFHPTRKWRADFVHHDSRTLIEVEGGIHTYGRHNRAEGFIKDAEKYLEATLHGYRVIRLVKDQITPDTLKRIKLLLDECSGDSIMDLI